MKLNILDYEQHINIKSDDLYNKRIKIVVIKRIKDLESTSKTSFILNNKINENFFKKSNKHKILCKLIKQIFLDKEDILYFYKSINKYMYFLKKLEKERK